MLWLNAGNAHKKKSAKAMLVRRVEVVGFKCLFYCKNVPQLKSYKRNEKKADLVSRSWELLGNINSYNSIR